LFVESLRLYAGSGHRPGTGGVLLDLANLYATKGQYQEARQRCKEVLRLFRELHDDGGIAGTNLNLALIDIAEGEWDTALDYLEAAHSAYSGIVASESPQIESQVDGRSIEAGAGLLVRYWVDMFAIHDPAAQENRSVAVASLAAELRRR